MKPTRVDRILEEWAAVARSAPRPESPARRIVVRSGLPAATLSGALVIVAAVAVAGILLGRGAPNGIAGSSASAPPNPTVPIASDAPGGSPATTTGSCEPAGLSARITLWEGAAGSRIAHVQLTNAGSSPCVLEDVEHPQLVDGNGLVLIDGKTVQGGAERVVAPGATLQTLVSASNYCGSAPRPPVSVAFVLGDGQRLVADPAAPDDATVPPCMGAGAAASIDMHAWAP
jgi:hypothetical protein